jgi:ketosteroid isomerase-like protein
MPGTVFLRLLNKYNFMAGEKHKSILLEGNAAIANGNNEGFLWFCSDDTEWTFVGDKVLKGKEAVRQWMAKEYLEPPKVTVQHLIADGEFLTAVGEVTVKDEKGKETLYAYCDVWRFRNEKIVGLKAFVIKI